MRLGLVVRGGLDASGRERVIPALLWLLERLAQRHEVHVFALHHEPTPRTYRLLGATVHDLGRLRAIRGAGRYLHARRLTRAIRAMGGVDVLHAYWALPAGLAATGAARRLRIPCVVTADSGEWATIPDIAYGLQRRWIDRHAVRMVMHRATAVTVCSHYMARLAAAHGVRPGVIPLGVDPPGVAPRAAPEGPPWRLVQVASLNRVKDHEMMLAALARVVLREPQVHLDIVGEDTLGGAAVRAARALGVDRFVTFHGFVPHDRLWAMYARAHLHVLSSRHEAAGVATLEAAAAGVPTAGTAVGFVADWAPARAAAVPVGDAAALADTILALLADPAHRARLASAACEWTLAHDADWTAGAFDRLYRRLTAGR